MLYLKTNLTFCLALILSSTIQASLTTVVEQQTEKIDSIQSVNNQAVTHKATVNQDTSSSTNPFCCVYCCLYLSCCCCPSQIEKVVPCLEKYCACCTSKEMQ